MKRLTKPFAPGFVLQARSRYVQAKAVKIFDAAWSEYLSTKTGKALEDARLEYLGIDPAAENPGFKSEPMGVIEGAKSLLKRPEGIGFSPFGDYLAIANSGGDNVLFYRTSDYHALGNQAEPAFVLGAPNHTLGFPHDMAFSPDGAHIAVACRVSNRVTVHRRSIENGFYEQTPFAVIKSETARLRCINAVKYSPSGNSLGVCDFEGHQIALFRYSGEEYQSLPYQRIGGSIDMIQFPDGLAFSRDGNLLAVTSHGTCSVLLFQKIPNSQEHYAASAVEGLQIERAPFCYAHSVSFSPLDDTLVASFAAGMKSLFVFRKLADTAPRYPSIPSQILRIHNPETVHLRKTQNGQGGVKGVAFSPDGKTLGLCASDIVDPEKKILFYAFEKGLV